MGLMAEDGIKTRDLKIDDKHASLLPPATPPAAAPATTPSAASTTCVAEMEECEYFVAASLRFLKIINHNRRYRQWDLVFDGCLHGMHHAWRFPAPGLDGFVGRCFGLSMSTKSVSRFKLSGRM